MRSHLLFVATFATTLAVVAFGFADPPTPPAKGGGSVGVSIGGAAAAPASGARPATSASAGLSTSGGVAAPVGSASGSGAARDAKPKPAVANAISKGHAAYMARDFPGAIQAYKEAIAQDAADPAGYYFLGEAQLVGATAVEADGSFTTGLRYVGSKDDWRGKLLFVIADLRERQGKWSEAKKAWEEYAQFLATHPDVKGYAATATERVKVVDARADLDTKYAPVKQRIEQRLKENASIPTAADETSSPAKKP